VAGLNPKTTEGNITFLNLLESMINYFAQFGKVVNTYIIYKTETNISRCFGFVEFENVDIAEKVHLMPSHIIDDKKIVCKFQINKKLEQEEEKRKHRVTNQSSSKTKSEINISDYLESGLVISSNDNNNSKNEQTIVSSNHPFSFDIDPISFAHDQSNFSDD